MLQKISALDHAAMSWLPPWRHRHLNWFFIAITVTGMTAFWFGSAAILHFLTYFGLEFMPRQLDFLRTMLCPLLAWVLTNIVKRSVARKRPSEKISGYQSVIAPPTCRSFPSSHSSATISFATALLVIGHPLAAAASVWAALVAFSRYYLGVHFPSDIIGGAALGIASAFVGTYLLRVFELVRF